jgi:hypothetical protein
MILVIGPSLHSPQEIYTIQFLRSTYGSTATSMIKDESAVAVQRSEAYFGIVILT